ncbi:HNH endonuclease [Cereibacter azotoformans]|uniref:HNH endonuclease signature motif containing protein n=1 Tax=Cereibacter azotoformans TaxID=43057 RepID=UPI001EE9D535|nr:HNH endonuclease signature motif containing protein [Cereibacter azotoformans]ULB11823.1 HNH endonuclease [Cereibacter azotoformans]
MSNFILRINGDTRCPGGINVPRGLDQWASRPFFAKRIKTGPSTRVDGTKSGPPTAGDRVYIWVIESGDNSHGRGLTAVATVANVTDETDRYCLTLSDLILLKTPVSVDWALARVPQALIIAEIKRFRPERIWMLSKADVAAVEKLISLAGGLLGIAVADPMTEALERHAEAVEVALAERKMTLVKPRPGQAAFRAAAFLRHGERCVFTGTSVPEALEAAHVIPHTGAPEFECPENCLLLRRDVHALFDLFFLSIDPATAEIVVSEKLDGSPYEDLRGTCIDHRLARSALDFHFGRFRERERS